MHGGGGDAFAGRPDQHQIVGAEGRAGIVAAAAGDVDNHLAVVVDTQLNAFLAATGDGAFDVLGQRLTEGHNMSFF